MPPRIRFPFVLCAGVEPSSRATNDVFITQFGLPALPAFSDNHFWLFLRRTGVLKSIHAIALLLLIRGHLAHYCVHFGRIRSVIAPLLNVDTASLQAWPSRDQRKRVDRTTVDHMLEDLKNIRPAERQAMHFFE